MTFVEFRRAAMFMEQPRRLAEASKAAGFCAGVMRLRWRSPELPTCSEDTACQ